MRQKKKKKKMKINTVPLELQVEAKVTIDSYIKNLLAKEKKQLIY